MISESIKAKRFECVALIVFIAAYIGLTIYHEPWFDEAEAWQIAKCASFSEILFDIPHYEGHPPLWHLILSIPAKLGVPFEIGLKGVGFLISVTTTVLLLFESRMPLVAKLLFPFSYFFFYQYGVIVRPYSLMLLILIQLGMIYHDRDLYPWRIVLLLILLCLTCAFGMVFACGIAICILSDVCREKGLAKTTNELLFDPRTQSLLALLIAAILIIIEILPRVDTYSPTISAKTALFTRLSCTLLTILGECFLTASSWFASDRVLLQNTNISIIELSLFCIIGLVLWILLLCISSKRNAKLILIPYILFALFAALVYFTGHHLGCAFALVLFWLEVESRDENRFEIGKFIASHIASSDRDEILLRNLTIVVGFACLIVPVYWSIAASIHEISMEYDFGRNGAKFLKDNNLEDCIILTEWNIDGSLFNPSGNNEDYINPHMSGTGVLLSAYFNRNMSLNLNNGDNRKAYSYHKLSSYEESEAAKKQWRMNGYPQLIFGKPKLEMVYGDDLSYTDYTLINLQFTNYIWKDKYTYGATPTFVRNDLVNTYHLTPMNEIEDAVVKGLVITDEMVENYQDGVSADDILKPYLNTLFGEEK